jgi:hypothetical protein
MSHDHQEKQPAQMQSMAPEAEGPSMGVSQSPPAFQLQASKGSGSSVVQRQTSVAQTVADYMATEMVTNAAGPECASIAAKWNSWNPISKVQALIEFADMVGYGKPWDHKKFINDNYGSWQADDAGGVEWYFDIWSNVHYGFVGRACGFSNSVLLNAAGIAQALGSQIPDGYWSRRLETLGDADVFRALDDPSDQAASRLGYAMGSPTGASLLRTMRSNQASLTHRAL